MGLFKFLKEKFKGKKAEDDSVLKYDQGLAKSRANFSSKLDELTKRYKTVDESYFEALEEILIGADCGVDFTIKTIENLMEECKKKGLKDPKDINENLIDMMFLNYLKEGEDIKNEIDFDSKPKVLFTVGVNGVGKTTTIAKLTKRYLDKGKKVLIIGGDTFRAGAQEQLSIWAERLKVPFVEGEHLEDPASVVYKGLDRAKREDYDLAIIDTAGRLQNKQNLMDELAKMVRVAKKEVGDEIECFLVLDATTGQNGVLQAKAFKDIAPLTGIVVTKMDGTSKGGIILAIREELGVPVRFIGLGEKASDLEEFDLDKYLYGLCRGLIEDE
jgi:fused signal recognition particle receptor